MPSDKRARQRAGRDIKLAAEQRRTKRRRTVRRIIFALIVVGAVIGLTIGLSSSPSKKKPTSTLTVVHNAAPTCPPASGSKVRAVSFSAAPKMCISTNAVYQAVVKTDVGSFVIHMNAKDSPAAVNNFVFLARYHFFDTTTFLRVIPGFVVQGGSPDNLGTGGPGYSFTGNTPPKSCEKSNDCYPTGSVAMANSTGPSSNGSQFFIVLPGGEQALANNGAGPIYTKFGTVVSGMNVVEAIGKDGSATGTPKVTHRIEKITIEKLS